MNKCIFKGRFTKDPETRTGQSGNMVVRFTIATPRKFRRDGDPDADFINFTAFGKTAEFIDKYFKKGNEILVTSRFQNDNYKDKDGNPVFGYSFIADEVEFCGSRNDGNITPKETANNTAAPAAKAAPADDGQFDWADSGVDEELPFI